MASKSELAKTAEMDVRERPFTMGLITTLSKGPTVPQRYKNKPNDMLAAVLVGRELGIEPMEAINSLFLVNGNVTMTGKLMSALVHRAGHELRVELTIKGATVACWRRDPYTHELHEVGTVKFMQVDAERADLMDKPTYKAYPAVMMGWRAISQACRIYFADVLSGVAYVPEEVNVDAPLEPMAIEEFGEVIVDGVDLDAENAVAEVVNQLDADVVG